MSATASQNSRHHVVVIGSGFGGLFAAKALKRADVDVTLVARTTHHLFQPLLYQVATGILSIGEIAPSTRNILAKQKNARVVLGDVTDINVEAQSVHAEVIGEPVDLRYDSLIVAAGAGQSYFGNDHFARYAPGLKTVDHALELRGRIFSAFELAELADKPDDRKAAMTFVVVGAGPTGVEMAGQIAEVARRTLRDEFRSISSSDARVVLLDAAPTVLGNFGENLSTKAKAALEKRGVEVHLNSMVVDVDALGLVVQDTETGDHTRIDSICKVWAAGVQASPLGAHLAEQTGAVVDRSGRVEIDDDLLLPGTDNIYVIGDMASLHGYPGVAQTAIQQAEYSAEAIKRKIANKPAQGAFEYNDKGSMATISRFSAIAKVGKWESSGFIAWLLWLVVHLIYITGFKNRFTTLIHWTVSFIGDARSERTYTRQQIFGRLAIDAAADDVMPTKSNPRDERGRAVTHEANVDSGEPTTQ